MGKRSDEKRQARDWYPTPRKGALPLIRTFEKTGSQVRFIEPFAGDGALTNHLCESDNFECVYQSDIEPQAEGIHKHDYKELTYEKINRMDADFFISNPPWDNTLSSGNLLFSLINHLSCKLPTWLLLDGGFAFNLNSSPLIEICHEIIPVGRLKWIPDSKHTGMENCAWFLFDANESNQGGPILHPRKKWK